MKGTILVATSSLVLAISWPGIDMEAALKVGLIVAVATVVVLTGAILIPGIAISAGATAIGTCCAVGGIALATGMIAGLVAGVHWSGPGNKDGTTQIEVVKRISNQLDIYFEPLADNPKHAVDYQCTLVTYEESDLQSRQPTVTTRKSKIVGSNGKEFFEMVEQQMKAWFSKKVTGDDSRNERRLNVYMKPYPGEGIYERIKNLADANNIRRSIVTKVDGIWVSAMSQ